jgi:hypothetical protein
MPLRTAAMVAGILLALGPYSAVAGPAKKPPPEVPDLGEYVDESFGPDLFGHVVLHFSEHSFGFGGGARFGWPILPRGFFAHERVFDALHLEVTLEVSHFFWSEAGAQHRQTGLLPLVGARYQVYLAERFALLAAAALGSGPEWTSGAGNDTAARFAWSATVGVLYDIEPGWMARLEWGWGTYRDELRLGVGVRF